MDDLIQLNIPKKINVGFQKRKDTYTEKLAYVVYTDDKGVLRKEKSWSGWRDHGIKAEEFDNVPTSGFVLNKKVGGHSGGWNPRQTHIRVYDPRDFEFEISVVNLLFILEQCSSIKGKGLEGDFVYAWDRADLVLLPVSSLSYKKSIEFTSLQTKKVTKEDMEPGCLYMNKDNQEVMYLGREHFYTFRSEYYFDESSNRNRSFVQGRYAFMQPEKCHVFVSTDGNSKYWTQKGFTKLAVKLTDEVSTQFPEEYDKFKNSIHGGPAIGFEAEPINFCKELQEYRYDLQCYIKEGNKYYNVTAYMDMKDKIHMHKAHAPISYESGVVTIPGSYRYRTYSTSSVMSDDEIKSLNFCKCYLKTEVGSKVLI